MAIAENVLSILCNCILPYTGSRSQWVKGINPNTALQPYSAADGSMVKATPVPCTNLSIAWKKTQVSASGCVTYMRRLCSDH